MVRGGRKRSCKFGSHHGWLSHIEQTSALIFDDESPEGEDVCSHAPCGLQNSPEHYLSKIGYCHHKREIKLQISYKQKRTIKQICLAVLSWNTVAPKEGLHPSMWTNWAEILSYCLWSSSAVPNLSFTKDQLATISHYCGLVIQHHHLRIITF